MQRKTMAVTAAAMATRPPITPPTIAPTGVECLLVVTGTTAGVLLVLDMLLEIELLADEDEAEFEVVRLAELDVEEPVS
jgi:hypothetical protein